MSPRLEAGVLGPCSGKHPPPHPLFREGRVTMHGEEAPERLTQWDYAACAASMQTLTSFHSVDVPIQIPVQQIQIAYIVPDNSAAWPGERVIADSGYDFTTSLQVSIARENDLQYTLFSLSPLSSPGSTPPSSPGPASQQLLLTNVEEFQPQPPIPPEVTTPSATASMSYPPTPSAAGTSNRQAKLKKGSKIRRNRDRAIKKASESFAAYQATSRLISRHIDGAQPISCKMTASELKNVASTGFVGLDNGSRSKTLYKLEDLVGDQSRFGFRLQHWRDGYVLLPFQTYFQLMTHTSRPIPIVDKTGLMIGILAGSPADAEWPLLHLQACDAIAKLRPLCTPRKGKKRIHRRGAFVALRCGVSHGGGQVRPKNLDNTPSDAKILEQLNSHPFFKRVAGFATGT